MNLQGQLLLPVFEISASGLLENCGKVHLDVVNIFEPADPTDVHVWPDNDHSALLSVHSPSFIGTAVAVTVVVDGLLYDDASKVVAVILRVEGSVKSGWKVEKIL